MEQKFAGNRPNFGIYIVTDMVLQMALIIMVMITATSSVWNLQAKLRKIVEGQSSALHLLVVSSPAASGLVTLEGT